MDEASFKNLNNQSAKLAIKQASKDALLFMWGGQNTTIKNDAAEIFANTFTETFADAFVEQLSENIVKLIQSASIVGTVETEPVVQGSPAIAVMTPTSGETPGLNNLKIKCI